MCNINLTSYFYNSSRISDHGGANPGATYNGRKESEDALALTLAVGSILEENGVDVYYTRTTDIYESPYQKAQEGNEVGGDYLSRSIAIPVLIRTSTAEWRVWSTTAMERQPGWRTTSMPDWSRWGS